MKVIIWIVSILVAILLVCFALANRDTVSIGLWPLVDRLELRFFVAILLAGAVGFLAGGLVAWSAQSRWRRIARERGRRIQTLNDQVDRLEARVAEQRRADAVTPPPALPAANTEMRQVAGNPA